MVCFSLSCSVSLLGPKWQAVMDSQLGHNLDGRYSVIWSVLRFLFYLIYSMVLYGLVVLSVGELLAPPVTISIWGTLCVRSDLASR